MHRHRNKRPSRLHRFRALRCTCAAKGAEKGCSDSRCPKCQAAPTVEIESGKPYSRCLRDPRRAALFSSAIRVPVKVPGMP